MPHLSKSTLLLLLWTVRHNISLYSLSFNTLRALSISIVQQIRSAKEMQYNV
jgi:hypothetical protein